MNNDGVTQLIGCVGLAAIALGFILRRYATRRRMGRCLILYGLFVALVFFGFLMLAKPLVYARFEG